MVAPVWVCSDCSKESGSRCEAVRLGENFSWNVDRSRIYFVVPTNKWRDRLPLNVQELEDGPQKLRTHGRIRMNSILPYHSKQIQFSLVFRWISSFPTDKFVHIVQCSRGNSKLPKHSSMKFCAPSVQFSSYIACVRMIFLSSDDQSSLGLWIWNINLMRFILRRMLSALYNSDSRTILRILDSLGPFSQVSCWCPLLLDHE